MPSSFDQYSVKSNGQEFMIKLMYDARGSCLNTWSFSVAEITNDFHIWCVMSRVDEIMLGSEEGENCPHCSGKTVHACCQYQPLLCEEKIEHLSPDCMVENLFPNDAVIETSE